MKKGTIFGILILVLVAIAITAVIVYSSTRVAINESAARTIALGTVGNGEIILAGEDHRILQRDVYIFIIQVAQQLHYIEISSDGITLRHATFELEAQPIYNAPACPTYQCVIIKPLEG